MKKILIAVLLLGLMPSLAMAQRRYDRGDRYRGGGNYHSSRSNNFFGFSFGAVGGDWFGGVSYRNYGGYSGYRNYYPVYRDYPVYRERYYAPPVYVAPPPVIVYREPAYCPPPVTVYSAPSYYYSSPPVATYYAPSRYYYGR